MVCLAEAGNNLCPPLPLCANGSLSSTRICNTSHKVTVGPPPAAVSMITACPFMLKTELFVQANGDGVIDVHVQLDSLQAQPIIGELNDRLHQRATDANAPV